MQENLCNHKIVIDLRQKVKDLEATTKQFNGYQSIKSLIELEAFQSCDCEDGTGVYAASSERTCNACSIDMHVSGVNYTFIHICPNIDFCGDCIKNGFVKMADQEGGANDAEEEEEEEWEEVEEGEDED